MAAKCCSSPAISAGSALAARWSGRSNALVVRGFTSSAPICQPRPRSPAARTPAPARGGPQLHRELRPPVRRLRATPSSTTTHAFCDSHFRWFWPRPAILRHDRGLAASPPVRYTLRVEGSGLSVPLLFCPGWTGSLLATQRRTARVLADLAERRNGPWEDRVESIRRATQGTQPPLAWAAGTPDGSSVQDQAKSACRSVVQPSVCRGATWHRRDGGHLHQRTGDTESRDNRRADERRGLCGAQRGRCGSIRRLHVNTLHQHRRKRSPSARSPRRLRREQ